MNIQPADFVLEIGSGHNPKARSDVLCDKFIDDDHQRGGRIVTDRSMIEADGQHLPFADNSFDYVICSHVLEHVEDPKLMISELERVASRGYIEVPSEISERLYGWPYHLWIFNLIDGKLLIQQKVDPDQFGQLFHTLVAKDKGFLRFHKKYHPIFLVHYEWEKNIDYEFRESNTPTLDFNSAEIINNILKEIEAMPWLKKWQPFIKDLIPKTAVSNFKKMISKQRHKPTKTLRDIIVCPSCKEKVKWEDKLIHCNHCDADYPILGGIPRLTPKT